MKGEATPLYYAALAASEPAVDLLLLYGGDAQNSNTGEKVCIAHADANGDDCDEYGYDDQCLSEILPFY